MLFLTVFSLLIGSSTELPEERRCYGGNFTIPNEYTPPYFSGKLTLHSMNTRLLVEDGQAKDSRIRMSNSKAYLIDLSPLDEGTLVVSPHGRRPVSVLTLKIDDCAEQITMYYGTDLSWPIPTKAEYIEFSRTYRRKGMNEVVWRRHGEYREDERGRMRNNAWEIVHATQASSGIYNIRAKDKTLLMRKNLTVEGHELHFYKETSERLVVEFPVFFVCGDMTFTPRGRSYPDYSAKNERFKGRLEIMGDYMVIDPVESTDSGTFEFKDQRYYPVMSVHLEVKGVDLLTSIFIGIAVGIILIITIIICCCCMKKHCKKSSSKRNELAPQSAAASATYYHDNSQQSFHHYSMSQ